MPASTSPIIETSVCLSVCVSVCLSQRNLSIYLSPSAETGLRQAYFVGQMDTQPVESNSSCNVYTLIEHHSIIILH